MSVLPHGRYMTPYFDQGKESARLDLGISQDETVILCIGFVQRHKKFDLVVDAVKRLPKDKVKLYVVGSMRVPAPEIVKYRDDLSSLINDCDDAKFREDFVSDVEFDQWIAAADLVVLPYEEIWSTGVGARCELLRTPMLIRRLASLVSQFEANPSVDFFDDVEELAEKLSQTTPKPTSYEGEHQNISSSNWRALFIMPWFGPDIRGGAEHFIFELARNWAKRGADVEVWTTCSNKLEGWNNEYPDGLGILDGVKIRRFPTVTIWEAIFHRVHARLNKGSSNALLRCLWVRTNLFGSGMVKALNETGFEYDSIHLCHYLTGPAHRLSGVLPEKTVLHPFIHNEQILYDPVMAQLFKNVRAVMVNTASERDLALSAQCGLVPRSYHEIGNGVEREDPDGEPRTLPTELLEIIGKKFIICVGRLIEQKNIGELLVWFHELRKVDPDIRLVFIGEGPYLSEAVVSRNPGVIRLGWVSEDEKRALISDAICLAQPSLLESFSLVVMEAWLQGTPDIVHGDCPATSQHIIASGGGYACTDAVDFVSAVEHLANRVTRKELGVRGKEYVRINYSWDAVVGRLEKALKQTVC
jgi:glycosyltransferase involved in cell wall biosynthesis